MPDGTCSVVGCARPIWCKRLCHLHYNRKRCTGETGPAEPLRRQAGSSAAPCSIEGCTRSACARGMCQTHNRRVRQTGAAGPAGRLLPPQNQKRGRPPCSVDGCGRVSAALGLCRMHRARVRRTGEAGAAEPTEYSKAPMLPCRVDECGRPGRHIEQQLCARHYERWLKDGDPGGAIRAVGSTDGACASEAECSEPIEAMGLCSLHYYRQYREANRDRRGENDRKWREANAEKVRVMSAEAGRRRRARLRELPAERYTMADIIDRDGDLCVLCGEPLDLGAPWPSPLSPTVEHLECISWPDSAGDVLTNVAASHYTCNCRRHDNPHPAAACKRAELLAAQELADQEAIA